MGQVEDTNNTNSYIEYDTMIVKCETRQISFGSGAKYIYLYMTIKFSLSVGSEQDHGGRGGRTRLARPNIPGANVHRKNSKPRAGLTT